MGASKKKRNNVTNSNKLKNEFQTFQFQYLLVYILTMFADWLQGTHMYALYDGYATKDIPEDVSEYHPSRYGKVAISTLFITGFACSGSGALAGDELFHPRASRTTTNVVEMLQNLWKYCYFRKK